MVSQLLRSLISCTGIAVAVLALSMILAGCGSTQDMSEEMHTLNAVGQLEYRIDSLSNENRRLKQQIEAVSIENRNLTARTAELNSKIAEAKPVEATPPPAPKPTPAPVRSADMNERYASAFADYRKRNFGPAMEQFEALLKDGIKEDLADNCHYWIGECLYGMGKYTEAIRHFTQVIAFKHTEKRDDAQMMIGNCYVAMGNKSAAREAYNNLIASYPASPFVRKAQAKLDRLK